MVSAYDSKMKISDLLICYFMLLMRHEDGLDANMCCCELVFMMYKRIMWQYERGQSSWLVYKDWFYLRAIFGFCLPLQGFIDFHSHTVKCVISTLLIYHSKHQSCIIFYPIYFVVKLCSADFSNQYELKLYSHKALMHYWQNTRHTWVSVMYFTSQPRVC